MVNGGFSFLRAAREDIEDLKDSVTRCEGTSVALISARAFGDIEASFCDKEIDNDKMERMKGEVTTLINMFGNNCRCTRK